MRKLIVATIWIGSIANCGFSGDEIEVEEGLADSLVEPIECTLSETRDIPRREFAIQMEELMNSKIKRHGLEKSPSSDCEYTRDKGSFKIIYSPCEPVDEVSIQEFKIIETFPVHQMESFSAPNEAGYPTHISKKIIGEASEKDCHYTMYFDFTPDGNTTIKDILRAVSPDKLILCREQSAYHEDCWANDAYKISPCEYVAGDKGDMSEQKDISQETYRCPQ